MLCCNGCNSCGHHLLFYLNLSLVEFRRTERCVLPLTLNKLLLENAASLASLRAQREVSSGELEAISLIDY